MSDPAASAPANLMAALQQLGLVTADQAQQIQLDANRTGRSVEQILIEKKFVTEQQLVKAKGQVFNVPVVSLSEIGVSPEALTQLSESVAKRYQALPFAFDKEKRILLVAMVNPVDLGAIEFIKQKTGLTIIAHFAAPSEISEAIATRYAQNLSSEVTQALEDTQNFKIKQQELSAISSKNTNEVIREAPITKIVETILSFAISSRASDVHIEPQPDKTRVRYRIDGILQEKLILPRNVQDAVVSRIKILSDLKIDEKRVPQDGRFSFETEGQAVDLRVSTLPTIHGEKVVMRLLKKNSQVPSLPDLGLNGIALRNLESAAKVPHGIVLVTGPTGSGKTTSLYSLLHNINTSKVNIMTLEDPVEYQMPGVNQVQVNPQAGLTFASGLRAFLRQDPNIIMVGEIRDSETVELAIQASLTGHLVFSTLHTSSAAGAIPRLMDMGAEPFLLISSLSLVMAQRVVRKIDPEQSERYTPEPQVIEDFKQVLGPHFDTWCKQNNTSPEQIQLLRPLQTNGEAGGYKGRIGIFEVMPITEEMNSLILENRPAHDIEKLAIKNGMLVMKQDGYLKALQGLTTIEEVLRVAEV